MLLNGTFTVFQNGKLRSMEKPALQTINKDSSIRNITVKGMLRSNSNNQPRVGSVIETRLERPKGTPGSVWEEADNTFLQKLLKN